MKREGTPICACLLAAALAIAAAKESTAQSIPEFVAPPIAVPVQRPLYADLSEKPPEARVIVLGSPFSDPSVASRGRPSSIDVANYFLRLSRPSTGPAQN